MGNCVDTRNTAPRVLVQISFLLTMYAHGSLANLSVSLMILFGKAAMFEDQSGGEGLIAGSRLLKNVGLIARRCLAPEK